MPRRSDVPDDEEVSGDALSPFVISGSEDGILIGTGQLERGLGKGREPACPDACCSNNFRRSLTLSRFLCREGLRTVGDVTTGASSSSVVAVPAGASGVRTASSGVLTSLDGLAGVCVARVASPRRGDVKDDDVLIERGRNVCVCGRDRVGVARDTGADAYRVSSCVARRCKPCDGTPKPGKALRLIR